jgi:hypothetical protein
VKNTVTKGFTGKKNGPEKRTGAWLFDFFWENAVNKGFTEKGAK